MMPRAKFARMDIRSGSAYSYPRPWSDAQMGIGRSKVPVFTLIGGVTGFLPVC